MWPPIVFISFGFHGINPVVSTLQSPHYSGPPRPLYSSAVT